jgi:signal transduction histidine kinase/ActR/RegA family two-component response regulator
MMGNETHVFRRAPTVPTEMPPEATEPLSSERKSAIRAEQIRLLYANSDVAAGVTIFVSSILCFLQSQVISRSILLGWLAYMLVISAARFALAHRYRLACPTISEIGRWGVAFTIGTGLSAGGWGAAGALLYPEADLTHQVLLVFVIGGMMLGAGSILAMRPEALLTFLIPAGLPTAVRFLVHGGNFHLSMGILLMLFTVATLITTWHIYQVVGSSLMLRFENDDLVAELQTAKQCLETLNEELDQRVQRRTAELGEAVSSLKKEITERQRAEEQRSALEESLRQAQKLEAVGALAGGIAHDFNNLLTSIAGYTSLVRDALPVAGEARRHLDEVLKAEERASNLVRRLLVFGRKNEHKPQSIPIADVVSQVLDLVRASLPARISLRQSLHSECGCVFADPNLIQQMFLNLCTNSIEAMAQTGGRLEVTLAPVEISEAAGEDRLPPGPYVRLTIRDTGPGIPSEIAGRIFEPFFTTKSPSQGGGLGLSVVHGIVMTYGGLVTFENTQPHGAAFFVLLPRLLAGQAAGVERAEAPTPACLRILVVDDEEAIARLAALLLRHLGHSVTSTVSSARALRLFMKEPDSFDLVITDLTMPEMNGKELARQLKQIRADIPIILMSGFNDSFVRPDEVETIGIGEFVAKPFSGDMLRDAIRRVLLKKTNLRPPSVS